MGVGGSYPQTYPQGMLRCKWTVIDAPASDAVRKTRIHAGLGTLVDWVIIPIGGHPSANFSLPVKDFRP